MEYIRKKDEGTGVEIEDIVKNSKVPSTEEIIESMLKEGEIFENLPGKVKILE
jgi:molecular chaperone DnaK (HSP70)